MFRAPHTIPRCHSVGHRRRPSGCSPSINAPVGVKGGRGPSCSRGDAPMVTSFRPTWALVWPRPCGSSMVAEVAPAVPWRWAGSSVLIRVRLDRVRHTSIDRLPRFLACHGANGVTVGGSGVNVEGPGARDYDILALRITRGAARGQLKHHNHYWAAPDAVQRLIARHVSAAQDPSPNLDKKRIRLPRTSEASAAVGYVCVRRPDRSTEDTMSAIRSPGRRTALLPGGPLIMPNSPRRASPD